MSTTARLLTCAGLAFCTGGCQPILQAIAVLSGGDPIDAKFKLTEGRLLILIDDYEDLVTQPRALQEVHKAISAVFLEKVVNDQVVPFAEWQELRQTDKEYDRLSVRAIGEKLGAEQVLYLRVTRFALSDEPGADIYRGRFDVRVKVITTKPIRDTRLWPEREDRGFLITASTVPEAMDGDRSASQVARELSGRLGRKISKLFYGHRALDE